MWQFTDGHMLAWLLLIARRSPWYAWWRHQMETFSALLAICEWNSPVTGEFPSQRPVTRSFDVFFDLRQNKRLSRQSRGWCFETQSRSLWRHCNEDAILPVQGFPHKDKTVSQPSYLYNGNPMFVLKQGSGSIRGHSCFPLVLWTITSSYLT